MARERRSGPRQAAPTDNTPADKVAAPAPPLDWRDARHWGGGYRRKCRVCHRPTFLLDGRGHAAHKVCVEREIAKLAAEHAADR